MNGLTDEQKKAIPELARTHTDVQIAAMYDVSAYSVAQIRRKAGVPSLRGIQWAAEQVALKAARAAARDAQWQAICEGVL